MTLSKKAERFYWRGMVEDVKESCEHFFYHCVENFDKTSTELHPIPVKEKCGTPLVSI